MKDKLELQKQYIEVKNKYDELSKVYWNCSGYTSSLDSMLALQELREEIKEQFTLLKSINKQLYYGESTGQNS